MTTTAAKYTPEQVAQMSVLQLCEAVARNVFGAKRIPERKNVLRPGEYRMRAYGALVGTESGAAMLDPDCSADGVFRVLEHMRQRWKTPGRYEWNLLQGDEGWSAIALDRVGEDHFHATAQSLGRAVFEAAMLASQEMGD